MFTCGNAERQSSNVQSETVLCFSTSRLVDGFCAVEADTLIEPDCRDVFCSDLQRGSADTSRLKASESLPDQSAPQALTPMVGYDANILNRT